MLNRILVDRPCPKRSVRCKPNDPFINIGNDHRNSFAEFVVKPLLSHFQSMRIVVVDGSRIDDCVIIDVEYRLQVSLIGLADMHGILERVEVYSEFTKEKEIGKWCRPSKPLNPLKGT